MLHKPALEVNYPGKKVSLKRPPLQSLTETPSQAYGGFEEEKEEGKQAKKHQKLLSTDVENRRITEVDEEDDETTFNKEYE